MCKIWAHRGYSALYPENTLLAFKKAEELFVDGIETDLQLTRDGKIVLIHDEKIDRTSEGKGFVKDYTYQELQKYSFCNHMDFMIEEGSRLLCLEDFFSWFKETDLVVNLELKTSLLPYPGLVEKTILAIHQADLNDRVILSSFNHHSLMEARSLDPEIPCGALTGCSLLSPGTYCRENGLKAYHPLFTTLTEEDWVNLKENGVEINPWTVNRPSEMKMLFSQGISHLITNEPALAIEALKEIVQ